MFPITCNAVGDIIAIAELVLDIARALNESRGSPSEYRGFITDLHSLHIVLASVSRAAQHATDANLRAEIILEVDRCGGDIQRALKRVVKFSPLAHENGAKDSPRIKMKRQWHKLEWQFVHRESVENIKAELATATQRLAAYLAISNADGINELHASITGHFDIMTAKISTSLVKHFAGIDVLSSAFKNYAETAHNSHTFVQRDHTSSKVDGSKAAASALLCLALCTAHDTSETVHSAILLAAVCILVNNLCSRQARRTSRAIQYAQSNSITLIDALDRRLVLPLELCATEAIFHATIVNLFSQTDGHWFIDVHKYTLRERGKCLWERFPSRPEAGEVITMDIWVHGLEVWTTPLCPVCLCYIHKRPSLKGDEYACTQCKNRQRNTTVTLAYSWEISIFENEKPNMASQRVLNNWGIFPVGRLPAEQNSHHRSSMQLHDAVIETNPSFNLSLNSSVPAEGREATLPCANWSAQIKSFKRISVIQPTTYLLDAGKSDGHQIYDQRELFFAAENGHRPLVTVLLDNGTCVNASSNTGYTALHFASFHGHTDVVALLLDRDSFIDAGTETNFTPLALAALNDHHATIALLLSRGAIFRAERALQAVVLYVAARNGIISLMQVLLRLVLDVNSCLAHYHGDTALHAAVKFESYQAIELLLQHGADINARSQYKGGTPLMLASGLSDGGIIFELLRASQDIEDSSLLSHYSEEDLALMLYRASEAGNREIAEWTLQHGADANVCTFRNGSESTPLMAATKAMTPLEDFTKFDEIVVLLLDHNADVELYSKEYQCGWQHGWRALHFATYRGHNNTVKILLKHGADVNARTAFGDTALALALKRKVDLPSRSDHFDDIANILVSWGAVPDNLPGSWPEESREVVVNDQWF